MHTPRQGSVSGKWGLMVVAALAVVAATVTVQTPAAAQDDDEFFVPLPVDQLVALPGSCPIAAPIEPGNSVDCNFQILPGVDPAFMQFSEMLLDGLSWPCHVEPGVGGWDRLVCPDLLGDRFEEGPVDFTLRIEGEVTEAAATATLTWGRDPGFSLFGDGEGESVVFEGRPLRWFSYTYETLEGLFLNFRDRSGFGIVGTVEIDVGEVFESADGSVAVDLPPGRYRLWPCVGATAATCEEQPGGRPFQIIEGEPLELVPGHNRRSADRINVLFTSAGLKRAFPGDPSSQLPELARTMLTINGPGGVDIDDNLLTENELATRLLWGPMSIEPLASHVDRFNFWYLPDEVADEVGMLFGGLEPAGDEGFDLPNLQVTALYNDGVDVASDARRTSFESREAEDVPARGRLRFGDARVWVPTFAPLRSVTTLAHEWGHGLFGLRDEYYGFDGRGIAEGYPNCAPDLETAELWWGHVIGQVDPFVDRVVETQQTRLQDPEFAGNGLAESTAIEITAGGCYSDFGSSEVYRPAQDSLMNSEVPVFGVVNRQRVQEVLDRFSGRGELSSLDELTISCEGLAGYVNCRGELLSHIDKPLSIVALNSNPCEFGSPRPRAGGSIAPVPITCSTTGDPDAFVELSFKSENRSLDVVDVNLRLTPTLPPRLLAERELLIENRALAEAEKGEDDPQTGRTVVVGVLLCVASLSLGFVEHRRRRSSEADLSDQ